MVKQTIKYVTAFKYRSAFSSIINHIPNIIQILILIALILTFAEYRKANKLTQESLGIAQKNIDLSQKSIDLTQQSVSLTRDGMAYNQKNIEIAQQALALTQKSVEATRAQLAFAQQANDISKKSLAASLSSWIEVRITGYKKNSMGMDIDYSIANNSSQPAHKVAPMCVIEGYEQKMFDISTFNDSDIDPFVILPKQTIPFESKMMSLMGPDKIGQIVKDIDSGKTRISIIVNYQDVLGNHSNFVESFRKNGGGYTVDEEYDAPRNKVWKILGIDKPIK